MAAGLSGFICIRNIHPKPVFWRTSPATPQIARTRVSSALRAPQLVNGTILRVGREIPDGFDDIAATVDLPLAVLAEDDLGNT